MFSKGYLFKPGKHSGEKTNNDLVYFEDTYIGRLERKVYRVVRVSQIEMWNKTRT